MFDAGPDRIDAWNPSDSWFAPSPDVNPVAYTAYRAGLAQNGSTERKLYAEGALQDTDSPSSPRPTSGTDMIVELAGGAGSEDGYGHYQFAWMRLDYMSDDWMNADNNNNIDPTSFYVVAAL